MGAHAGGQAARQQLDVRTREADVASARNPQSCIARLAGKRGTLELDEPHVGEPGSHDVSSSVGATRDDDHLERLRALLRHDRADAPLDHRLVVLGDHDGGQQRPAGGLFQIGLR